MSTKKFHSLLLASGAVAENFHFERLAEDPVVTEAGRFWVNTGVTAPGVKFSKLNGLGAVEICVINDKASMDAAVAALTVLINNVSGGSTSGLDTERSARVAADALLQTAINEEIAARISGDNAEADARAAGITAEAARADAAIVAAAGVAADATATEALARQAGDVAQTTRSDAIQAELDVTQAGAGLSTTGAYIAPTTSTYLGTATSLANADQLLDSALAAETATRIAQITGLGSQLANEVQMRIDEIARVDSEIKEWVDVQLTGNANADLVEQAARIAKDNALQTEIDQTQASIGLDTDGYLIPITNTNYMNGASTVFGAAAALDSNLARVDSGLTAEIATRTANDTALQAAVDLEKSTREQDVSTLLNEINSIETGSGLESDGTFLAPTTTTYLSGDAEGVGKAVSLKDASVKLDAALASVASRVTAVETTAIPQLQAQLAAEVTRATDAETTEQLARVADVATVTARIAAQETKQVADHNAVVASVVAEVSARQGAVVVLQDQIDDIVASSGSGATALKAALNAGKFNYKSSAPANEHTITHGFGHQDYAVNIMVKGDDGVWRNDSLAVEDIDLNSFKVYTAVLDPRDVRVNVISTAVIA